MSDNIEDRGPEDRSLISLEQDHEVEYWTKALDCTEEDLKEAIAAAGNSASKVREFLGTPKE